jgi:hypothetical protein
MCLIGSNIYLYRQFVTLKISFMGCGVCLQVSQDDGNMQDGTVHPLFSLGRDVRAGKKRASWARFTKRCGKNKYLTAHSTDLGEWV